MRVKLLAPTLSPLYYFLRFSAKKYLNFGVNILISCFDLPPTLHYAKLYDMF